MFAYFVNKCAKNIELYTLNEEILGLWIVLRLLVQVLGIPMAAGEQEGAWSQSSLSTADAEQGEGWRV